MAGKVAGRRLSTGSASSQESNLPDVTLMLLGKTGAGKSSLGNAILNLSGDDAFEVTFGFLSTSVYSAVAKKTCVHDRIVKIVDTPGVMDTNASSGDEGESDEKTLQGISEGIAHCCTGVDAFLLVIKLGRLTREEFESVNKLEKLFGVDFWRYVILVFTHGDVIGNDPMKFEQNLNEGRSKIEHLNVLMKKLTNPPILVDSSEGRQPQGTAGQMTKVMNAVDMLVSKNKTKYTNELFAIAKAELKTKEISKLRTFFRQIPLELKHLKEKICQLQSERENDQAKMERLEQQNSCSTQTALELKLLREKTSQLQSEIVKGEAKIAHLEQQNLENKKKLDAAMKQAVEKTKEVGRKSCSIL